MHFSERIRQKTLDLGFDVVGLAPAEPPACAAALRESVECGHAAAMSWLARSTGRRARPDTVLPGARSVVAAGFSHFVEWPDPALAEDPLRGRIAAYAWGPDYHDVLHPRLEELGRFIEREKPGMAWRAFTDTGPVLERHFAAEADLGFIGRNTLLISPRFGSFLSLGVLLLDIALEYDEPSPWSCTAAARGPSPCGRCVRCLTACPTAAFPAAYRLDARRCISYLTTEHREAIPPDLRAGMGNWIFGCDRCQQVCPWTRRFSRPASRPFLRFDPERWAPRLTDLPDMDERRFRLFYEGTPVARIGRRRLLRNAIVALGNSGAPEVRPALERMTREADELLREHALWALGRLGPA